MLETGFFCTDSLAVNPEYCKKCDTATLSLVLHPGEQSSSLSTWDDCMVHSTPWVSSVSLGTPCSWHNWKESVTGGDHGEDGVVQLPQATPAVIIKSRQSSILSLETDFAPTLKILLSAPVGNSHESWRVVQVCVVRGFSYPSPTFL